MKTFRFELLTDVKTGEVSKVAYVNATSFGEATRKLAALEITDFDFKEGALVSVQLHGRLPLEFLGQVATKEAKEELDLFLVNFYGKEGIVAAKSAEDFVEVLASTEVEAIFPTEVKGILVA